MGEVLFSKKIDSILNNLDLSSLGKNVAIKLHFGEKGCTTYINPEIVKKVYNKIISLGKGASLVECNVLYQGERMKASSHIKLAKEHGFDFAPIDILDGEVGDKFIEIEGCKLGTGIKKYDSLIVLSHFKGHMMAGFGGALKNIGMGLGSRAGKLDMHSKISPSINSNCIGCGLCVKNCGAGAIRLVNGKAQILADKCTGCAMCIAVCPNEAVSIPWGSSTSEDLQRRIVEYSGAVLSLFPNPIFINVLENITEDCDCMGRKQEKKIEDIGFVAGNDIVSVDKASLDLANRAGFEKVQRSLNKNIQIDYACELGIGEKEYILKEIK